jgi:hypothetical protein
MPKISELAAATAITGSDTLAIVQAGDTKQLPVTAITGYARTAAEIAASVTPTAYQYPPGDVRRYGATGNGTTDDTAAVVAAINAAKQNANTTSWGGTPVYFPAGIYSVTDGVLTYGSNATGILFYGDGPTSSTLKLATNGTAQVHFYDNSGAQSYRNTFRDLRFLGASTTYCNGFRLNDSAGWEKKFWFQNCRFEDLNYIQETTGTTNADQCAFFNCEWYLVNSLLHINNVQSMLHQFYGCYGTFKKDLIVMGANGGGEVLYQGGDLIHIIDDATDHYWVNGSAGPATGVNNGQFMFCNVRSEHRGPNAKLVYWPVSDITNRSRPIQITFDTCTLAVLNQGAGTTRSNAVVIGEGKTVLFRGCVLPKTAAGSNDDFGYTITADNSGATAVANPGSIIFRDCSVQGNLPSKVTITNAYGVVEATGCIANEGGGDTGRPVVNFSRGWDDALSGAMYAQPKIVGMKRRFWPYSNGASGFTNEYSTTIPAGAVLLRATIYKASGAGSAAPCQYHIGTDDKGTAYVSTTSANQNAEHKATADLNIAPLASDTTFRLYMTETTPNTCTGTPEGGYAFIEYI